ncbi:MAG: hypothetical protein ABI277_00350 [Burkholderiaceae bacterium]
MQRYRVAVFTATLFSAITVQAATPGLDESLADVMHRWARITYQTPEGDQKAALAQLVPATEQLVQAYPGRAEALIWEAIVLSSEAKADGGLGALSKVKRARQLLLDAEKIDPNALNGSIYSSLGSLYAKVPSWPIGFGDRKVAKGYFEKALAISPDGIDANYFYGEMLAGEGDYPQATRYLAKALGAPARPGREDSDAGRRQEARVLLASVKTEHDRRARP